MIINMVHSVTLLAVAINHVKLNSSVQLEYLPTTIRLRHYLPTWSFKQCVLLCPLYIIFWLRIGRPIGLMMPSIYPQHFCNGAPLALIALLNSAGSNHTRFKDVIR